MARTFRNESTLSRPLEPKLMFWCVSYHQVRSLRKIPTRLRGTDFCTSSARFALSFVSQPNGPQCPKIVLNEPKHEFRVQWDGSGAFVAKNSDTTSWHEHFATKAPYPPHWNLNSCFGAFHTIGCIRCKNFRCDFVARTFALVQPILHRVSSGNQTAPNAPK